MGIANNQCQWCGCDEHTGKCPSCGQECEPETGQYSINDLAMIEAMEKFGGSFVQALAQCFRHADYQNYRKLCYAFRDYCDQYRDMAQKEIDKLKK